jgi:nicotinate-nucleotide adenylyltransferase
VIGADSLAQFFTWKEPLRLLSTCEFVVVGRPGVRIEECDPRVRDRVRVLDTPLLEISSTDIRDRVRSGRPFRYLVPPAVCAYIEAKNLYS